MPDLREQLRPCLQGRFCLMGLGNADYGDDGVGVRLAERLEAAGVPDVIVAGTMPERFISSATDNCYDSIVFLDAVEFGAAPGSIIFLNAEEIIARFPQVSTHKISLGLMAKWIEDNGKTKAFLLGIQPESLKAASGLTLTVQTTFEALSELLCELWHTSKEELHTSPHCKEWPDGRTESEAPITEVTV